MAKNARLDHQETSRMSIWSRSIVKLVYYSARCGLSSCSTDFTEGHSTTNIGPPTSILYIVRCIIIRARDRSMTRTVTVFSIFSTTGIGGKNSTAQEDFFYKEWFSDFLSLIDITKLSRSISTNSWWIIWKYRYRFDF